MKLLKGLFWSRKLGCLKVFWRVLIYLFLFLLSLFLSSWLGHTLFGGIFDNRNVGIFATGVIYILFTSILIAFAARVLDKKPLTAYGFSAKNFFWADITVGTAVGFILVGTVPVAVYLLAGWGQIVGFFDTINGSFALSVLALLVSNLAIGYAEEVTFRGYIISNLMESLSLTNLNRKLAVSGAVIISSLLFMLSHLGVTGGVVLLYYFIFGVMFAFVYLWTGNLILCVALHAATDFAFSMLYGEEGTSLITLSTYDVDISLLTIELLRNTLLLIALLILGLYIHFTRGLGLRVCVRHANSEQMHANTA